MQYLMGIDLGSTSIKAVIYDTEGRTIAFADRPEEVVHLDKDHPTWAYWDPAAVWGSTCQVIGEAMSKLDNPKALAGVAVTGMGMDGLPLDKDGQWLYPFISWHCPRTIPQSQAWSEKVGTRKIFDTTGKQVMHIDSIYRLIWMKENHPEILAKTDKWLLIEDFVNFMLCGRQATDLTMASCTSVLDQASKSWSEELIAQAGIDFEIFPEPLPSGTPLGEVTTRAAEATGLPKGTPIILGGHDYICAALAAGAYKPGVMMDITGTWEIVLQTAPRLILNSAIFDAGLLVESHVAKDAYLTAGYSPSGLMMEWFNDNYAAEEQALEKQTGVSVWQHLMDKAVQSPAGSLGAMFLPHFAGTGPPAGDSKALGAFVGLSPVTGKGAMIRAMIEGLDYQFRQIIECMEGALGGTTEKIIAVGGASRNKFWMQNKADVTGKLIEVPALEEATTLGTALLAGMGVGIYKSADEAYERTFKIGQTYEPDTSLTAQYSEYYQIWQDVYAGLKEANWKIFEKFKQ